MENRTPLLQVKDLEVKFHVRGRTLTAIRKISLDIFENESIAIVGESGSGKSVFTKAFAGMLDNNGFISNGEIIYNDHELAETNVVITNYVTKYISRIEKILNNFSKYELGSETYKEILKLKQERKELLELTKEENDLIQSQIDECVYEYTELNNLRQTLDARKEKDKYKEVSEQINEYKNKLQELENKKEELLKSHKFNFKNDVESKNAYNAKLAVLEERYNNEIQKEIPKEVFERNKKLAKEVYLSVGRYDLFKRIQLINKLVNAIKEAMKIGTDLSNDDVLNSLFGNIAFRVKFIDIVERDGNKLLHGTCVINLANIKFAKDWQKIRGRKIATVFQDPMTSLNPIVTIGKQISSVIMKHQNVSEIEARKRAIDLMKKVGIPNAEYRYDDYPFQYSGGMRQRIVIAIALSCQPKILICDEPTTALDVTIQAQILQLIKDLQKEFNFTIIFITHDLGVVANIADKVAVLYAGQVVEVGNVDEIFFDPRHPYTWALLSSMPQLAERNTTLYSITGTPPSLYNKIVGDPFAPRNPYCLKIDTIVEPPMFKVTDTHYAKTWLLDPRSPKVDKPEIIKDIHKKLSKAFNI